MRFHDEIRLHQASFMSARTPRPSKKSIFGEWILKKYAPATRYVGLHFDKYDNFIFPPVIKSSFIQARPQDNGHITVYLPAYQTECIKGILQSIDPIEVHWFVKEIKKPQKEGNIHYFPVDQKFFNESLLFCHGLLTGGGFETPAEALYLRKKLLTIPIEGQYEQQCNAAALEKMGVPRLSVLDSGTAPLFYDWVYSDWLVPGIDANNIKETLHYLLS